MDRLHKSIEAEIPRLRRYARALCRDVAAADDLVQDCLTRALAKLHLWQEGTDLRAFYDGKISVTPLHIDLTHAESVHKLRGVLGGAPPRA